MLIPPCLAPVASKVLGSFDLKKVGVAILVYHQFLLTCQAKEGVAAASMFIVKVVAVTVVTQNFAAVLSEVVGVIWMCCREGVYDKP